jgi:hypothetical protein
MAVGFGIAGTADVPAGREKIDGSAAVPRPAGAAAAASIPFRGQSFATRFIQLTRTSVQKKGDTRSKAERRSKGEPSLLRAPLRSVFPLRSWYRFVF